MYQLQSPSLAEKDTKLHFQHVSQNFRHAAAEPSATKPFVSALQSLGNIVSMVMTRPEALLRCVVVVGALYAASDRLR